MLSAQLRTMQAQVEPHFLFNTLATVQHLVEVDPRGGSRMLASVMAYLRAALPQMREAETTLGREFALARAYLEVMQVRMGERLRFDLDLPQAIAGQPMPPMMLISLVENAIKHGVEPMEAGGNVRLAARAIGEQVQIEVSNDGADLDPLARGGTGLSNIRERLRSLFCDSTRLTI